MRVTAVFSAVAALAGLTTAVVLPAPGSALATRATIDDLIRDASYLFGWQSVGMATQKAQLATLCQNAQIFATRLDNAGLDGQVVQGTICLEADAFMVPDTTTVTRFLQQFKASVFSDYLIGSFNETSVNTVNGTMNPLAYLCQYGLSYAGLTSLDLDPTTVFNLVCAAGGVGVPSNPGNEADYTQGVMPQLVTFQSRLFGLNLAIAASTDDDLTTLCTYINSGVYDTQLAEYNLNKTDVAASICSYTTVIDTDTGLHESSLLNTLAFVEILGNAHQDVPAWYSWLCYALSCDAMNLIGLNSQAVIYSVCGR